MQNNPLIESVRALAEAQKKAEAPNQRYVEFSERTGEFVEAACDFDFPALLAALERAEAGRKLLKELVDAGLITHDEPDCPEDDTCTCARIVAANFALSEPQ